MNSSLTSRVLVVSGFAPAPVIIEDASASLGADRGWPLAEALAAEHDVILALPVVSGLSHKRFAVVYYNSRNIGLVARDSDVVVCDAVALAAHTHLMDAGRPLAVDLSAAVPDECGGATTPGEADVLTLADFFICSSEEERREWLPALERAGRINPHTLEGDSGLRRLIEVVRAGDRMQPLLDYCTSPRFAADRGTGFSLASVPIEDKPDSRLRHFWRRLRYVWRAGGARAVCSRAVMVIKRKISGRDKT